ncbi:MAG: lytic transglycosylase domain-containing protein, partial [Prevotellaceae bacterium]|nr:lytic transglycosylase domain-containing protein [Prevotellaceae bacterium]
MAQPSAAHVNMPTTVSLDIPSSALFCGEKISLERYDMRERYDREQLTFQYMHSSSIQLVKRANRYFPVIEPILKENGVPDDFKYLATIESMLDPRAVSPAKAAGIWQFLESTGREFGLEVNSEIDERYHVEKATVAACKYLKSAYAKYGDWATVAAAYNAGMHKISAEQDKQAVQSSFDMLLASETSRYVFRILAVKAFLENPQKFGFKIKREHLYHTVGTNEVKVSGAIADWT